MRKIRRQLMKCQLSPWRARDQLEREHQRNTHVLSAEIHLHTHTVTFTFTQFSLDILVPRDDIVLKLLLLLLLLFFFRVNSVYIDVYYKIS